MDDSMIESLIERRTEKAEKFPPLFAANWPDMITQAASRPDGARYYRCALQVNTPFQDSFKGFDSRHRRGTAAYQRDYALSLAKGCKKFGIDVIGLCDHNNVEYVETVRDILSQEGIIVFPGFEVASTEGIHILCLFDPEANVEQLDHFLTELGLPPQDRWTNGKGLAPRQSPLSFPQILKRVQRQRQGICIAAHVERENGLLYECAKTTRAQYFTDPNLLAVQIAGRREDLKGFYRKVIDGEYEHYQRQQTLALLNCLDVYNLKDLGEPVCSTWIKMSSPSIEGLWQAFLDPDSRLRLLSEEPPKPHTELVAIAWQGGFLDGGKIHFNENLNCLIGGRGAGKSTVIESLRYVLDLEPIGEEVRRSHAGILQQVLRTGTRVSLLVRSHFPSPCHYLIERTYPEAPVVRDEEGNELPIHPGEILPGVEIFGQHEIAEIAKDPAKQYQLLRRFRKVEAAELEATKQELCRMLEANRLELAKAEKEMETVEEKLSRLPAVEEKLRRYKDLGIETKLQEQSLLAREESIVKTSRQRLPAFKKALESLHEILAQNLARRDATDMADLPNADLMERLDDTLASLEEQAQNSLDEMANALKQTEDELLDISEEWEKRRQAKRGEYEKMLRELHKESIDGADFMKLRKEYEMLVPLQKEARKLKQQCDDLLVQRHQLLEGWEEAKLQLFEFDQEAAGKITEELAGRVRASVVREFDLSPLFELLKRHLKGLRTDYLYSRLHEKNLISLADFIQHVREGKETLRDIYGLQDKTAAALAGLSEKALREMEELELPTTIRLELNTALQGQAPNWKEMQELSTGQKATVILLLLFLESETPLVIDQPEDDLDNSFIAETIIPTLRQEKRRRQFLFATHNANLPVLGDAELIVTLEASGEGETGSAKINDEHIGAIDLASVKYQVEQILEGGKQAFEMRRAKYGF
jgi:energy-coupling factor transporter ATP-binding protein EcfA2